MVVVVVGLHHRLEVQVVQVEEPLNLRHLLLHYLEELQLQLHLYKVILAEQLHQRQHRLLVRVVVERRGQVVVSVLVEVVGIQFYHHLPMELLDLLHQLHYTDILLVEVVEDQLPLVVLVVVVMVVLVLQGHPELQILVVVEEGELLHLEDLVVLASSLFNIQNKEVKSYGTLCTDWL
jgi:hypothetical protein